jgi:uncharacterized protein YjbJ (UPF0337 family)
MADEYTNDKDTYRDKPKPGQDLGTKGTKDQVAGKAKEVAGKVQSGVGDLTGDESLKAKGKAKEVEGKEQQTGGKVERKVDDAIDPNKP